MEILDWPLNYIIFNLFSDFTIAYFTNVWMCALKQCS